ncbi:MBL fold metallo-hydrolase [Microlunatus panaciterrae]|uniref:Ribonuclease BN (tRNA processing enzyme) n=1 Tax=Microlunatus panaciterrae TaxID=400768 RepID=A0ABS2RFV5_9ACTN|nr:ribonuclease BN (tRNA processing enzyme) [Microlunatus panaciterrae]
MKLTVLGGCGGWPTADQACSGYLVEQGGFTLLIDPGYGVLAELLHIMPATHVDAVFVSHGHPDHCADLSPLLRARVLGGGAEPPAATLPVFAPAKALDRVLDLDQVRSVRRGCEVSVLKDGSSVRVGPFELETVTLPHHVPNLGLRLTADDDVLAYTGDSGPCSDRVALAKHADVLLAEASYPREVPAEDARYLSTASQVAHDSGEADAGLTLLTHLLPGQRTEEALAAVAERGISRAELARPGLAVDVSAVLTGASPRRSAGPMMAVVAADRPRRAIGR